MIRQACPFCWSPRTKLSKQQHFGLWHWVTCMECGGRGPRCNTQLASIKGWNQLRGARRLDRVGNVIAFPIAGTCT